jgi:hypothetical protein
MLMMMHHMNSVQQLPIITINLVFDISIKTIYPFRAIDIMMDTAPTY